MLKVSDILLKENYEFIISDYKPIYKVTIYGIDLPGLVWNSIGSMIDFLARIRNDNETYGHFAELIWNHKLGNDAELYFYFYGEDGANDFIYASRHWNREKAPKIEIVESLNEQYEFILSNKAD